jgi:hypothetical protein
MSRLDRLLVLAFCLGLGTASACGEDDGGAHVHDGLHDHDAAVDEEEEVPCTEDYPVYREGMTVKAGDFTVQLLSVSPAPPRQQTANNWMLQVVDSAGAPASGVTIENPDSYMPVHRHHGRTVPKAVPQSEPGKVQIAGIDFKMRGPWQVNFDVVPTGQKAILTTFSICVQ